MVFPERLKTPLRRVLTRRQRNELKTLLYGLLYGDNLARMAELFGTDKQGSHHYARHYERHFRPLRRERLNILEIGVGGFENPAEGGRPCGSGRPISPAAGFSGSTCTTRPFTTRGASRHSAAARRTRTS